MLHYSFTRIAVWYIKQTSYKEKKVEELRSNTSKKILNTYYFK